MPRDTSYKRIVLMPSNFQGGRDYGSGFKRQYKGAMSKEILTALNQMDFSAELSRVTAATPDAIFVFCPRGLGINFVRQYQQLGLLGSVPLLRRFLSHAVEVTSAQ